MTNISLKIKVKYYNGLFSEPNFIYVMYGDEKYKIQFENIHKSICINKSEAYFSLENPYISVIGKKVLLDRYDLTHVLSKAQKFELCFNQDVDNILYCKSKIIENSRHWSSSPVEFPVKLNVKNIKKTDITDKQWKYIFDIEEKLGVCFAGVTKGDAREFIGKYSNEMCKGVVIYAFEPSVYVWDDEMARERMESC